MSSKFYSFTGKSQGPASINLGRDRALGKDNQLALIRAQRQAREADSAKGKAAKIIQLHWRAYAQRSLAIQQRILESLDAFDVSANDLINSEISDNTAAATAPNPLVTALRWVLCGLIGGRQNGSAKPLRASSSVSTIPSASNTSTFSALKADMKARVSSWQQSPGQFSPQSTASSNTLRLLGPSAAFGAGAGVVSFDMCRRIVNTLLRIQASTSSTQALTSLESIIAALPLPLKLLLLEMVLAVAALDPLMHVLTGTAASADAKPSAVVIANKPLLDALLPMVLRASVSDSSSYTIVSVSHTVASLCIAVAGLYTDILLTAHTASSSSSSGGDDSAANASVTSAATVAAAANSNAPKGAATLRQLLVAFGGGQALLSIGQRLVKGILCATREGLLLLMIPTAATASDPIASSNIKLAKAYLASTFLAMPQVLFPSVSQADLSLASAFSTPFAPATSSGMSSSSLLCNPLLAELACALRHLLFRAVRGRGDMGAATLQLGPNAAGGSQHSQSGAPLTLPNVNKSIATSTVIRLMQLLQQPGHSHQQVAATATSGNGVNSLAAYWSLISDLLFAPSWVSRYLPPLTSKTTPLRPSTTKPPHHQPSILAYRRQLQRGVVPLAGLLVGREDKAEDSMGRLGGSYEVNNPFIGAVAWALMGSHLNDANAGGSFNNTNFSHIDAYLQKASAKQGMSASASFSANQSHTSAIAKKKGTEVNMFTFEKEAVANDGTGRRKGLRNLGGGNFVSAANYVAAKHTVSGAIASASTIAAAEAAAEVANSPLDSFWFAEQLTTRAGNVAARLLRGLYASSESIKAVATVASPTTNGAPSNAFPNQSNNDNDNALQEGQHEAAAPLSSLLASQDLLLGLTIYSVGQQQAADTFGWYAMYGGAGDDVSARLSMESAASVFILPYLAYTAKGSAAMRRQGVALMARLLGGPEGSVAPSSGPETSLLRLAWAALLVGAAKTVGIIKDVQPSPSPSPSSPTAGSMINRVLAYVSSGAFQASVANSGGAGGGGSSNSSVGTDELFIRSVLANMPATLSASPSVAAAKPSVGFGARPAATGFGKTTTSTSATPSAHQHSVPVALLQSSKFTATYGLLPLLFLTGMSYYANARDLYLDLQWNRSPLCLTEQLEGSIGNNSTSSTVASATVPSSGPHSVLLMIAVLRDCAFRAHMIGFDKGQTVSVNRASSNIKPPSPDQRAPTISPPTTLCTYAYTTSASASLAGTESDVASIAVAKAAVGLIARLHLVDGSTRFVKMLLLRWSPPAATNPPKSVPANNDSTSTTTTTDAQYNVKVNDFQRFKSWWAFPEGTNGSSATSYRFPTSISLNEWDQLVSMRDAEEEENNTTSSNALAVGTGSAAVAQTPDGSEVVGGIVGMAMDTALAVSSTNAQGHRDHVGRLTDNVMHRSDDDDDVSSDDSEWDRGAEGVGSTFGSLTQNQRGWDSNGSRLRSERQQRKSAIQRYAIENSANWSANEKVLALLLHCPFLVPFSSRVALFSSLLFEHRRLSMFTSAQRIQDVLTRQTGRSFVAGGVMGGAGVIERPGAAPARQPFYATVEVRRNHVFEDAFAALKGVHGQSIQSRLSVRFYLDDEPEDNNNDSTTAQPRARLAAQRQGQPQLPFRNMQEQMDFFVNQFREDVENGLVEEGSSDDDDEAMWAIERRVVGLPRRQYEAGAGDGVYRDFMFQACRQGFSPDLGLFIEANGSTDSSATTSHTNAAAANSNNLLVGSVYPNPDAKGRLQCATPDLLERYRVLGMLVGKAMYDGILLEVNFAPFFRNLLLGRMNTVTDVASYDTQLYKSFGEMRRVAAETPDKFEEIMGLYFTVTTVKHHHVQGSDTIRTTNEEVPLLAGGESMPVTAANVDAYITLVADYYLNRTIHRFAMAFREGMFEVLEESWIKMFDSNELQVLFRGGDEEDSGLDVADWRRNTTHTVSPEIIRAAATAANANQQHNNPDIRFETEEGEHASSMPSIAMRVVNDFWYVVEHEFTPTQQRSLLQFATSMRRAPLLGFSHMTPKFNLMLVGGSVDQLPTAATCFCMMKMPCYPNRTVMKEKLLMAIEGATTFELA